MTAAFNMSILSKFTTVSAMSNSIWSYSALSRVHHSQIKRLLLNPACLRGYINVTGRNVSCHQARLCKTSNRLRQISLFVSRAFHKGSSRFSGRGNPRKLPFEVDANVPRDTLIYKYSNDQYYKMISIFGIVQFLFWGNLALFSYSGMTALTTEEGQSRIDKESFWGKVFIMQTKYKVRIAIGCICVGYLVMFFTWLYPQRSVSLLHLLKGGEIVRIQTYTHFGRTREFTVPLEYINCKHNRLSGSSQIALKIKGSWFHYLMDNNSGRFYNTELFDNVVGLKRQI